MMLSGHISGFADIWWYMPIVFHYMCMRCLCFCKQYLLHWIKNLNPNILRYTSGNYKITFFSMSPICTYNSVLLFWMASSHEFITCLEGSDEWSDWGGYLRCLHHRARWTELPLSFIQLILAISEIPQFFPYNFPWFQFLVGIPQVSLLWLYPHISPIPLVIRVSRLEVYMNCSCLFRCHVAVAELYISCCSRPKGWFLLRVMEVNWDWVPKSPKQRNQCLGCFWRSHEHWEVFSRWCGG